MMWMETWGSFGSSRYRPTNKSASCVRVIYRRSASNRFRISYLSPPISAPSSCPSLLGLEQWCIDVLLPHPLFLVKSIILTYVLGSISKSKFFSFHLYPSKFLQYYNETRNVYLNYTPVIDIKTESPLTLKKST